MWPTPFGALHVNIPPRYIYPPKYGFFNKLWIFYWRCNSSILLYLIPIVLDESFIVEKIFLDAEAFPEWFEVFEDVVEPVARAEQRQQWRRVQILGNVKQNVWKMKHPKLLRDHVHFVGVLPFQPCWVLLSEGNCLAHWGASNCSLFNLLWTMAG